MNLSTLQDSIKTTSSREIAELTNKQHSHVVRDIELLNETLAEESLSKIGESIYTAANGQQYREYLLTQEQCADQMTGYTQALFTTLGEAWVIERLTSEGVA